MRPLSCVDDQSYEERRSSSVALRGVSCSRRRTRRGPGAYGPACPSTEARRLAPRATFLVPDFDSYTAVSKAIVAVFRSVTSVVESASIDEAFLDLTGAVRMFGSPTQIGEYVRAVVADEQQITCSVGIGPTKFVAKVASRAAKPDGLVEVPPEGVAGFLHPLPVEAMWGVGHATAQKLHRLGIYTVGDLAHTPRGTLRPNLRPARRRHAQRARVGQGSSPRHTAGAGAQRRIPGDFQAGHRRS